MNADEGGAAPVAVLAGGGTAGHVNPLLATAAELQGRGFRVVVLGTDQGLERDLVPAEGLELRTIEKVPMPRRLDAAAFAFPGKLRAAVAESGRVIRGASVVVGFGGYVAAPAYVAARRQGVPVVIHEQNARPGWANRLGARWAAGVGLTFPGTPLSARSGATRVVGMPLRRSIAEIAGVLSDPDSARRARSEWAPTLGLIPDLPTLLVTGGSLGAQHLNEVLAEAASSMRGPIQVLHLTGKGKAEEAIAASAASPADVNWQVREYLQEMERALACADLVVCRSGAGTVAELSALGVPAVYVPLPVGNGEQALNAASVVAAGGALLVEDAAFTPEVVADVVLPLLRDPERLQAMGAAARSSSPGDGAKRLADLIEEVP